VVFFPIVRRAAPSAKWAPNFNSCTILEPLRNAESRKENKGRLFECFQKYFFFVADSFIFHLNTETIHSIVVMFSLTTTLGVNITPWGQSSPLGDKIHPWGPSSPRGANCSPGAKLVSLETGLRKYVSIRNIELDRDEILGALISRSSSCSSASSRRPWAASIPAAAPPSAHAESTVKWKPGACRAALSIGLECPNKKNHRCLDFRGQFF
jgi:hypothetical protein